MVSVAYIYVYYSRESLIKSHCKGVWGQYGDGSTSWFLVKQARPSHMSDNSYISLVAQMLLPEISDHGD